MSHNEELQRILHQLLELYKGDKVKLIKFCLARGHMKQDIAEALGITPSALSYFIRRNNLQDRESETK
jgi:predicted transcriptional regulator